MSLKWTVELAVFRTEQFQASKQCYKCAWRGHISWHLHCWPTVSRLRRGANQTRAFRDINFCEVVRYFSAASHCATDIGQLRGLFLRCNYLMTPNSGEQSAQQLSLGSCHKCQWVTNDERIRDLRRLIRAGRGVVLLPPAIS